VKRALVLLLFLLGCRTPSQMLEIPTTSFTADENHAQAFAEPYFYAQWKTKPVVLYVGSDNVELYSAIEHAVSEINQAVGFPLLIFKGVRHVEDGEEEYKGRNQINTIIEVPDSLYIKVAERTPKSLAVTKLITSKKQLYEADILIRSSTIQGSFLRATILHELGHLVGLGHTQDKRSFMYPEVKDPHRFVLGRDDAKVLSYRYASSH
jgi:hypothetical protein